MQITWKRSNVPRVKADPRQIEIIAIRRQLLWCWSLYSILSRSLASTHHSPERTKRKQTFPRQCVCGRLESEAISPPVPLRRGSSYYFNVVMLWNGEVPILGALLLRMENFHTLIDQTRLVRVFSKPKNKLRRLKNLWIRTIQTNLNYSLVVFSMINYAVTTCSAHDVFRSIMAKFVLFAFES